MFYQPQIEGKVTFLFPYFSPCLKGFGEIINSRYAEPCNGFLLFHGSSRSFQNTGAPPGTKDSSHCCEIQSGDKRTSWCPPLQSHRRENVSEHMGLLRCPQNPDVSSEIPRIVCGSLVTISPVLLYQSFCFPHVSVLHLTRWV